MGSSPDLYVDIGALEELGRQLRQITSALGDADARIDAFDSRTGSRRVEDALDDFVSGWRDGRKKILGRLEGLSSRVDAAISTYNEVESRLAAVARGAG